jgi:hypothetical protein
VKVAEVTGVEEDVWAYEGRSNSGLRKLRDE